MEPQRRSADRGLIAFAVFQGLFFATTVGWGAWRALELAQPALPSLARNEPLSVTPRYDVPEVVSDEQLAKTLLRLRLPAKPTKPRINHLDHALRFWSLNAAPDSLFLSGAQMRQILTDHRRFAQFFGDKEKPFLLDRGTGLAMRTREGDATASHVDHTLACLAEMGTPLDFPLITSTRRGTYRELVEQSLRDFSVNQAEYEWSILTYALFLPPASRWQTSEGQWVSFDDLADRLMRESQPRGVCFGNHRLFTLAALLSVDQQEPIISKAAREKIVAHLDNMSQRLARHQHPEGFWNGDWATQSPATSQPTPREGDRLSDRLLATGHALEWLAIAPREVHPPRPTLASAGQWLVRSVEGLTEEQVEQNFTYLTHVGRALALWRSRSPASVLPPSESLPASPVAPSSNPTTNNPS